MKPTKGLYIDTRPTDQPDGTYPYGKNGIQYDIQGSIYNEPGFKKLLILLPYKFMGVIETDDKPIVFSTNNINSAVGYLDLINEVYVPIIDDNTWSVFQSDGITRQKIGFNTANYITGQSQRNYKSQTVCTFTDKNLFPMYLNCDAPNIKDITDLRLFAFFSTPTINPVMGAGGSLPAGAYYVAIGYEKTDGTSTAYSAVSKQVTLTPGALPGTADKLLSITINNVDTSYNFLRVAIISKVDGVTTAVELASYIPIAGPTVIFTYTGGEITTDIDVSSVLTPPTVYDKITSIGQLNDYLYIGGLHQEIDIDDMQQYALQVHLEWISQLIDAVNPPQDHINGITKGLTHEEVYAYYIRYRKARGGFSKWFHIPGPSAANYMGISSIGTAAGLDPYPKFMIEDTIPYKVGFTGGFGAWQNNTEKYPDTPDYDLTSFGGENLRNKPVRHHRTPSQRWCKANLYSSNQEYGRSKLDLLGVQALNVHIPDKYKGIIDGYDIGYAVRTVDNMTNLGQSSLLNGITDYYNQTTPTANASIYSSGGNYRVTIFKDGSHFQDVKRQLQFPLLDTFRMHPFDLLFNQPSIVPSYLSAQWSQQRKNLNDAVAPVVTNTSNPPPANNYIEDGDVTGNNTGPLEYIVDYTTGEVPVAPPTNCLRKVLSSFYCPNNVSVNNFVNSRTETAFCGYLVGAQWPTITSAPMGYDYANGNTHNDKGLQYEQVYHCNIMALKLDLYNNFYSQSISLAGDTIDINAGVAIPLWGGDTFISAYTYHTYGKFNSLDENGDGIKGIKMVRRIVCESISNINLRFVDPANPYSQFWPKTPLVRNITTNYVTQFDRALDPNQFGYTKSFNALNDLVDSTIWNPFTEYLYDFPYRVHRGGLASRTGRPRSWRTFLPLDYKEIQKNMGPLIHLEGMDDRLIIHMRNCMFLTQDKSKLESGPIAVTLGTGDIFQFEPQEVLSSKLGYAGTQHDLACVRTPFGYVFVDALQGEIYLYKGKLSLLNEGLNTFLRDFLKIPDVNSYIGNGITIGWDQRFKRIIMTVKNKQLPNGETVISFQDTPNFWNNIQIGQIVSYQGRYIQYVGLNNTSYQCPPDPVQQVTTWQPVDSYCVKDGNGNNTGVKAYNNRIRLINGEADGYKEPNTPAGLGTYFPPVTDITTCALPAPVITWVGQGGKCLTDTSISCNPGYTLSSDQSICTQINTQSATPPSGGGGTPGIAAKANSTQWNNGGAKLTTNYNLDGTPVNPTTDVTLLTIPHFWVNGAHTFDPASRNTIDSRMNVAGIWVQGGMSGPAWTPVNEFIGFSRKITVSSARTVYVMMCADNTFKFLLNGVVLVDLTPNSGSLGGGANFNYANIFPVPLQAGDNYIEMYAENFGLVAGFAAEIYDISLSQLLAATQESDLNIIFSTKNVVGEEFNLGQTIGWSCPAGWSLDTTGVGDPVCKQILTQTPTTGEGDTPNGQFLAANRCRVINGTPDGYCEPNTSDGSGQGPYLPPAENPACEPVTPPSGETININGTIDVFCSDDDCINTGFAEVTIVFLSDQVLPQGFTLLFGQIIRFGNTTNYYVGSDIMGGIPGGAVADPDYVANGANVPFLKHISPQDIQIITVPTSGKGFTLIALLQKDDTTQGRGAWNCNNCNKPILDIYIKIESVDDSTDPNTYVLNLTSFTGGINIHNM